MIPDCPICHSTNAHIVLSGRPTDDIFRSESNESWSVLTCGNCGLSYTFPRVSRGDLERFYTDDYFADCISNGARLAPDKKRILEYLEVQFDRFSLPRTVLDVGCGRGELLNALQKEGWQGCGVEMSSILSQFAREKLGVTVFQQTFEQTAFENQFSLAVAHHVIEHAVDPVVFVKQLHATLNPKGIAIIGCPNWDCLQRRIFGSKWWALMLPQHLQHFSRQRLDRLLREENFEIITTLFDTRVGYEWIGASLYATMNSRSVLIRSIRRLLWWVLGPLLSVIETKLGHGADMIVVARKTQTPSLG
jgi:SAM-dependent methyltransferase